MKKSLYLFAATLLTLGFSACSNEEAPPNTSDSDNVIRLSSSIGLETRAGSSLLVNHFANGTSISVQVTDKAQTNPVSYSLATYTDDGSGNMTTNPVQYYPAGGGKVDIYAYYPSNAASAFEVATDQSGDDNYKTSDLMYASLSNVTKNSNDHVLQFSHKLSKISVTLVKGNGVTDDDLSQATIQLKDVIVKGTFTHSSGQFEAAADENANKGTITIATSAGQTQHSAIVVPQSVTGKQLSVSIGGTEAIYTMPETTFAAGSHYTYNITVSRTGISVTSSITDWTSTDAVNGSAGF